MPDIFTPATVKRVRFQNRVVMPPMVRFGFPSDDGVMGERLMRDYLGRAGKGIGLIMSQVLSVSADRKIPGGAGAYSDKHIAYLSQIADAYHEHGTRFFAQLGLGGYAFDDPGSGAYSGDVNELTTQELDDIRDSFIHAARICRRADLDGIELHGAHTFFLNMMASSRPNRRQDCYGGDLHRRLTLAREIIAGIKAFAEDDFLISYRMGWSDSLEEDVETALVLEEAGVDLLHVSFGIPRDRALELPTGFDYHDAVYTARHVKKHVTVPVIAVNGIKTLRRGRVLIENGWSDFVAYGKPFLADADFLAKSLDDPDYHPCRECKTCQWFTDGAKCPAQVKLRSRSSS